MWVTTRSILRILPSSLREAVPANGCAVTQSLLDVPCLPEELLLEALNCAVASPEYRLGLATARDGDVARRRVASACVARRAACFEGQSKLPAGRRPASSHLALRRAHLNERIHKHSTKELYAGYALRTCQVTRSLRSWWCVCSCTRALCVAPLVTR